ncbi:YceI family protein [Deinococcus sp.]|uniref:YceI family protein n=1 Tax=Deinococcus sp. TaxID=47478 RepID=UPI0025FD1B55|nr:YceI family protein [Deinococcus sp.]
MKTTFWSAALLSSLLGASLAAPYTAAGGQAVFDYRVTFIGVRGTTPDVKASMNIDPDNLAKVSGTVNVTVATFKTGNGVRDGHMRGALGADEFKDAVFTLSAVQGLGKLPEGQQVSSTVVGQLSLKGVARTLSAPVKLKRVGNTIEVATQFKFNPHDFGVDYFGGANDIAINVSFKLGGS